MGVDYSGNFGIGIQIFLPEFEEDHEWFEDETGWLDEILKDKDYFYFEVGEGSYTGEQNEMYLCIDEPFEDGYCGLTYKAKLLIDFLEENNITYEGKVDVVGGLNVW